MKKVQCLYNMSVRRLTFWLIVLVSTGSVLASKASEIMQLNEFMQCIIVFFSVCIAILSIRNLWAYYIARDILLNGVRTKVKVTDICKYEGFSRVKPRLFITGEFENPENRETLLVKTKTNLDYDKTLSSVCNTCTMRNHGKGCTHCKKENKFLKYRTMYIYLYYSPSRNIAAIDQYNVNYTEQGNESYTNNYTYDNFEI